MSSILVSSVRANIIPTSVDPDTYDRLPVLPSVRRNFSADDVLLAAAEIYASPREKDIQVVATLKDMAGQSLVQRDVRVSALDFKAGSYRYAVQIPLNGVTGDLVLGIEASPVGSTEDHAARGVALRVASR